MPTLGFVQAFAKFGAKLDNPMWACSALAADGALVVSCWSHYFKKSGLALHYVDCLSRWSGNDLGNRLMRTHLEKAKAENLQVRMVVATAKEPELVEKVSDAGTLDKTFHVRDDVVGRVLSFDGDNFIIEFTRLHTHGV